MENVPTFKFRNKRPGEDSDEYLALLEIHVNESLNNLRQRVNWLLEHVHVTTETAGVLDRDGTRSMVLELIQPGQPKNTAKNYRWMLRANGANFDKILQQNVGGTWTDRIVVDADGNVGIGTGSPDGTLHVHTGSAGTVTAPAGNTGIVVENSGGTGITLLSPDASDTSYVFGSPGDSAGAILRWNFDSKVLQIGTAQNAGSLVLNSGNMSRAVRILPNGNVGIQTDDATLPLSTLEKCGMTPIGGFAIKLTNKTGGNSVAGQLLAVYSATAVDDAVKTAAANDDGVIGITLDADVSDGSKMWVVVSGIADILMDGGGSARGDRIISSATAGSADVWNVGGAVATHFQELGHCIETRTGAGLAKAVIHLL